MDRIDTAIFEADKIADQSKRESYLRRCLRFKSDDVRELRVEVSLLKEEKSREIRIYVKRIAELNLSLGELTKASSSKKIFAENYSGGNHLRVDLPEGMEIDPTQVVPPGAQVILRKIKRRHWWQRNPNKVEVTM